MFIKQAKLGVLLAMIMSSSANADLALIGHSDSDVGSIDTQSVKKIFLGERKAFPSGIKAIPVNHATGSPDRKEFFETVLGMSEDSHKRHWTRMRMTSLSNSPVELSSYEELLDWVAKTPGSIAYIDARHTNDSVKVLLTIKDFEGV